MNFLANPIFVLTCGDLGLQAQPETDWLHVIAYECDKAVLYLLSG